VPGDGKFDQNVIPSNVELQVGRVDFRNMPVFSATETELLRRYLNKDHAFRHAQKSYTRRGLIDDDYFGVWYGEAFAASGWRNFSTFFGATNSIAGDWKTSVQTQSYLWGYGCAPGGDVADPTWLSTHDPKVPFTMIFGSIIGDWDSTNATLRATIAPATNTLTCVWAGRPHWPMHHMALGETIGYSTRVAQNNGTNNTSLYPQVGSEHKHEAHMALMGDPTLRMHPVAPPTGLTVSTNVPSGYNLAWIASLDTVNGYVAYRGGSSNGPFSRLNVGLLTTTNYTDLAGSSTNVYMIRAVKLEVSGSGSYYNPSQGVF
jgi:hypothetical protein